MTTADRYRIAIYPPSQHNPSHTIGLEIFTATKLADFKNQGLWDDTPFWEPVATTQLHLDETQLARPADIRIAEDLVLARAGITRAQITDSVHDGTRTCPSANFEHSPTRMQLAARRFINQPAPLDSYPLAGHFRHTSKITTTLYQSHTNSHAAEAGDPGTGSIHIHLDIHPMLVEELHARALATERYQNRGRHTRLNAYALNRRYTMAAWLDGDPAPARPEHAIQTIATTMGNPDGLAITEYSTNTLGYTVALGVPVYTGAHLYAGLALAYAYHAPTGTYTVRASRRMWHAANMSSEIGYIETTSDPDTSLARLWAETTTTILTHGNTPTRGGGTPNELLDNAITGLTRAGVEPWQEDYQDAWDDWSDRVADIAHETA